MRVEFTVLGEPKGKGRPQFSTYGGRITTRTPKDTVIYENLVRIEYQRQCGKARFAEKAMLRVEVTAYYGIPKSASQKKRRQMLEGTIRPTKKPDSDNVLKSICDSLNGIAYRDDAQVVDCIVKKLYSDVPRVEVSISSIPNAQETA